jgi:hypothetical protein
MAAPHATAGVFGAASSHATAAVADAAAATAAAAYVYPPAPVSAILPPDFSLDLTLYEPAPGERMRPSELRLRSALSGCVRPPRIVPYAAGNERGGRRAAPRRFFFFQKSTSKSR